MVKKKKVKKISLKKKLKRVKEQKGVLFKVKPLEGIKKIKIKIKIKKPSKPVKSLVKTVVRPLFSLGKPIPIGIIKPTKPKRSVKPVKVLIKKTKQKSPILVKSIEPAAYKARIKVIGIGGGGSSIVSEIASEVKKVTFVVANTDFQALQEATKEAKHFQFGKSITQGLGTGMNPELGEQAAESDKEKIKELLKETDFCILVSCLGGGSGSGASPVFANILKNFGILTLGIFTLPFEFEGEKRAQIAKDSLEKLRQNLNALVIIPNQKIFQIIDKNAPLKEALSTINKALIENLEGLITLIYSSGLIRVDFADLKTILAGKGRLAYLNSAEAKGPNQIEELAKKVVSSPLIPYTVQGAKEVLFNIDGGLNLNMSQVEQIGKTISSSINPKARVAFGITQNKKEEIKITLLVSGCKWEEWEQKKEKPKKKPKEKQALITKIQDYNLLTPEVPSRRVVGGSGSRSRSEQAPKPKKKVMKKTKEKLPEFPKVQQSEITQIPTEEPERVEIKVRKNALEMKESIKKEEKKMMAQERKWETPAFLRRKPSQFEEKSKAQ